MAGTAERRDQQDQVPNSRMPPERARRPWVTRRRDRELRSLNDILDQLDGAALAQETVTVGDIHRAIGQRSFGPLLLVPGLVVVSPLSGIPGLPTMSAIIVMLLSAQLLVGARQFWLPGALTRRHVSCRRLRQAVRFLRPIARAADAVARPRLLIFTRGIASYAIAAICLMIALTMPVMEIVPMANSMAGGVISIFGLALIADDGLLAVLGLALMGAVAYFAVTAFV